ncbi:TetR/AcrR family transcriptional regulator [Actinomadura sp. 7K507]|uniref:TetR/AcrR family transcriptional regulator n=1 Tax=Actinomadura sp. 7K507 TaxID=2530365 RepID=UPI001047D753|nr:TetR/AcrR family transcriptional regulator [Actinomadura sp. 7K507]TDC82569.1 TetR/AcrR family transcriptional regulator [Actinomadura sp. 7K507]
MSREQPPSGQGDDLRVRRTRRQLRAALLELSDERGYDAVTVGDITDRASVNRATFYRHFEDKEDLATDVLLQVAMEAGSASPVVAGGEPIDLTSRIESGTRLFEHFAQHHRLYQPLLVYPRHRRFMVRAREAASVLVRGRIQAAGPASGQVHMPEDLASTFATELLLSVVAWWLDRGMPYSPRQMATWFVRFFFHGGLDVLGLGHMHPGGPRAYRNSMETECTDPPTN